MTSLVALGCLKVLNDAVTAEDDVEWGEDWFGKREWEEGKTITRSEAKDWMAKTKHPCLFIILSLPVGHLLVALLPALYSCVREVGV